jgi:hypothetical protein
MLIAVIRRAEYDIYAGVIGKVRCITKRCIGAGIQYQRPAGSTTWLFKVRFL